MRRAAAARRSRQFQLERLEQRMLLTGSPELVGVQPNDGSLLQDDDILGVAPRQLTFQFNQDAEVDPATLGAIQVMRSGLDGSFESAFVRSDMNTGGLVVLEFSAVQPGPGGNGLSMVVTASDHGDASRPTVSVSGRTINVDLNTRPLNESSALDLLTALNTHPEASQLVMARIISGSGATKIATRTINYSPLVLSGANAATVSSNFNSPTPLSIQFTAVTPGIGGNGLQVVVTKANLGTTSGPRITVDATQRIITAELNTNSTMPTTAQALVDAINTHPVASGLIRASIPVGNRTTNIATPPINYSPLVLRGANDVMITPGFLGLGDSPREVIMRFAETLPDDVYQINILGAGPVVLRDADGSPFNNGDNLLLNFELDLGAQVVATIPQPVVRNPLTGVLEQRRNEIHVYFNDDDLDPTTAEDPRFYQLIFTRNTVENTDDVVFFPASVEYDPAADRAILRFSGPLETLEDPGTGLPVGPGTFRLRIGTDEATPPVPQNIGPGTDAGSSFSSAQDIGILGGTSQIISADIGPQPFPLDLPGASDEPGHRDIPVQDHLGGFQYLGTGAAGATADTTSGIATQFYNFQDVYGFDPQGNVLHNAITETQKQRAREVFEFYSNYLGIQFVETANQGFTIVTGDLRAASPGIPTGPGGVAGIAVSAGGGLAIMDLQDFNNTGDDVFGGPWFQTAMHEIGHLLGLGHTDELPPLTILNDDPALSFGTAAEPVFPGDHDIVHGQHLLRPDSNDIDLYQFELQESGRFSAETIAERLADPSLLDTVISLYSVVTDAQGQPLLDSNGNPIRELIARNDDYFSEDSFLELDLGPGTYFIAVTASGNTEFNPILEDTGFGGTSQGVYDLRLGFRPNADQTIVDSTGTALDGDADGLPGGVHNFWFRAAAPRGLEQAGAARTLFVDKSAAAGGNGSLGTPFNNIGVALAAARPNDLVRILGNGGADSNLATTADNLPYELGFRAVGGTVLADGAALEVPRGVTVMIDSGAILKLRRSRVGVGSSAPGIDRSAGALQVLGTPHLLNSAGNVVVNPLSGAIVPGSVYFTSVYDTQLGKTSNPEPFPPDAAPGNWGGIVFRNDLDRADSNRFDYEKEGIFLNSVNNADIRYGGGTVVIDGVSQLITPIHVTDTRPTISFSHVSRSSDAAISATPNSFEETNFHSPPYQAIPFTADYDRVGPDIHHNSVIENSINGLFIRIRTPAGNDLRRLTVAGRWDDTDIVHVVSENLEIEGTPGGPVLETDAPPVTLITLTAKSGGNLAPGTYNYRLVFVDAAGNEGPPSEVTRDVMLTAAEGSVELRNLPPAPAGFVARRLYRSTSAGVGPYVQVAEINATATTFVDDGSTRGGVLQEFAMELRPRLDARLAIDAGTTVKLDGVRIETGIGAQLIAEGTDGHEVVFTSLRDDRFGMGGTFDTNNDDTSSSEADPAPGDWGGLLIRHVASASVDHAIIAHAGGVTKVEGSFAGFNAVEIHQAAVRIANSRIEDSLDGTGGQAPADRFGRSSNAPGAVFIRGAQPAIVDNIIRDNEGPAISINANALNHVLSGDTGRTTGLIDVFSGMEDNAGPLVRLNRMANNEINAMEVRAGTLTTEGVWDDTDIVHVLQGEIFVTDFHTYGGLRLASSPTESLVVKLSGPDAGFTAVGKPLDIDDRIGGVVQVVGQPRFPVVLTSINDCTVGAGLRPNGAPQRDTLSSGLCVLDEDEQPASGNSGAVVIDGGDRDDHGSFSGGANQDGWLFIEQMIDFANRGNRNAAPNDVLVIGADVGGFADQAIMSVTNVLGLTQTNVNDAQITSVNFNDYKIIYVPSNDINLFDGSGISDTEISLLAQRKAEIQSFVNNGGSLVALTESEASSPYAWLELPQPFQITDFTAGGIAFPLRKTPEAIAAGFTISDAELSNGVPYHNDFVGPPGFNGLLPFVRDTGNDLIPGNADDRIITLGLGSGSFGIGVVNPSEPGDWRGVQLQQYSHDRNVDTAHENEPRDVTLGPDSNQDPDNAQYLGALAESLTGGDDNLRLGFVVHGYLNQPSDVDVYSFEAKTGTEVWFDIDRTSQSVDTVVELIDANGVVVARSDNSLTEAGDSSLLYRSPSIPGQHVNPLAKSGYYPRDNWSSNPRDAGMRVVLPGVAGATNTYHVRVRSSSPDLDRLHGGLTSGAYQLQIRLSEIDEFGGSTVQYSDIRFATNGIEILGQPIHSPLMGEIGEDSTNNDSLAAAQQLGNLLNSDRATLSIAGDLGTSADVDIYRFDITYDSIQDISGVTNPNRYLSTILDLDYADGLGRANTVLSIFDSAGNLILTTKDSNVAEDRPGPLNGTDLSDLSRGTVGALDPFLGSVELPEGTYFVAVSSDARVPQELEQFLVESPTNPLLRLEPIDSLNRIAEDHIGFFGGSTFNDPQIPILLDTEGIVPFHLGDVVLFLSRDSGFETTAIQTIDPFTGATETTVGGFGRDIGDIAMRPDGNLFAYTLDLEDAFSSDADAGNYLQIDTGTGAATNLGDDTIETWEEDPANLGTAIRSNLVGGTRVGDGIHFDAITYGTLNGVLVGLAVGGRPAGATPFGVNATRNLLYQFDPQTGVAFSAPQADRAGNARILGAGTNIVERGELLTDADVSGTANTVIVATEATLVDNQTGITTSLITDGMRIIVDHDNNLATPGVVFEFNSGPEVRFQHDPPAGVFVRDGDKFLLDGIPYEFNTGAVIVVTALNGNGISDGDTITITDDQMPLVTRTFEFDDGSGPPIGSGNIRIGFDSSLNQAQLISRIVGVINSVANFNVVATALPNSNRITLTGDSTMVNPTDTSTGILIQGNHSSNSGGTLIQVEEIFDSLQLATAIDTAFNGSPGVPGITASVDGDRINFSGAKVGSFTEIVARGVFTDVGSDGFVGLGNQVIDFLARDLAAEIAAKIATAINNEGSAGAVASGKIVTLSPPAVVQFVDPPLQVGGAGPGGNITGMAFLGSRLFAVSDAGGLYQVLAPLSGVATLDYIESSVSDLLGIDFQGLAAGPSNVEGGRYANMLFGIDRSGELYAFDTNGILQPIFVDGATSVDTGFFGTNGIAFSTLDRNLWDFVGGVTGRAFDPGHGVNPAFDNSRFSSVGGSSLHFGLTRTAAGVPITYNFPGGAHGSVESNFFSLEGYSAADEPVLYFNYFADTEQQSTAPGTGPMRDALRVFIADESGEWELLATNNSYRPDELSMGPFTVQEVFDNAAGWRQVRVSLAPFAGRDNLQLRFDFSTAGSMNAGDTFTTGDELRVVPASELRDGQTIVIDSDVFEIDLGYTLLTPSGSAIGDGDTLTVSYGINPPITYEFDTGNGVISPHVPILFDPTQSPSSLAETIERTILQAFIPPSLIGDLTVTSESNDTIANSVDSGLLGGTGSFRAFTGIIGDNAGLTDVTKDVDLVAIDLNINATVTIDIDARQNGSLLNSMLRLFDANGNELAFNDNAPAPGESFTLDPFISFTAPRAGTYYIGISGFNNRSYNPSVAESGSGGSTGFYDLEVIVNDPGGFTQRNDNRLQLPGAVSVTASNPALKVEGSLGASGIPVVVHAGMTAVQVAEVLRYALADTYSGGVVDVIKSHDHVVRVIGHDVISPGPMGLTDSLPGDLSGAFNSNLRGQNNSFEGVYIDDLIIGFAERGEMVTGAAGNSTFVLNPLLPANQILVGPYQLEVRRAAQYGDAVPGGLDLFRGFDTNDRLAQQTTLLAPAAYDITDGQTFTISDGVNSLVFEYDDLTIGDGVTPGRVRIPFDPAAPNPLDGTLTAEPAEVIAQRIRDMINSPAVQAVLDITAASADGAVSGPTTTPHINLFGNAVVDLLSPGLVITSTTTDGNDLRGALLGPGFTPIGPATFVGGSRSAGFFTGGTSTIGIESGIILTTGDALFAEGPNTDDGSSATASGAGDADLDAEFGFATEDTSYLEFSFETTSSDLFFNFVFASEEYNEFSNSSFNDVFAFFIDGENIALIPGTITPISINTINGGNPLGFDPKNPQFYNNNDMDDGGAFLTELGYDGFTDVFVAQKSNLTPGVHTIKLAISDVGDSILDSAVFIEAFNAEAPDTLTRIAGTDNGEAGKFLFYGDKNLTREQGQVLIHSNTIQRSLEFGVLVDAGSRDGPEGTPHAGPPRNLRELNTNRLVPGVTITNNILASNSLGGIHFSGETNAAGQQVASVPFGRIINNTIVGGGVGIQVDENASPTILNNIVANLGTGISVDASSQSTVLGGTVYKGNSIDTAGLGLGSFPIQLGINDPLFVNTGAGNFYLEAGSPAIDSAIDTLQDRPALVTVKDPMGLPLSPILAPDRDLTGQLRVDDPTVNTPPGQGSNVFKDRGAIDRSDFSGPSAVLLAPRDNDSAGNDSDGRESFVQTAQPLTHFSIQLLDGLQPTDPRDGVGVDDLTFAKNKVSVFKDGALLRRGVDYRVDYDTTNKVIIVTPLAGIWEPDRTYEITLVNRDRFVITTPQPASLADGTTFDVTDQLGTTITFEFESGFRVLVPAAGGGSGGIGDGQRFTISTGIRPPVTFEFDSNNLVAPGNVPIRITTSSTADEIADKIVVAVASAALGLAPANAGGGIVHLGGTPATTLVTSNSNLVQSGMPGLQTTGATPVPFTPAMTPAQLSAAISSAINGSSALSGVFAEPANGEVFVQGAADIVGVSNTLVPSIKDLAGNNLKANRTNGETRFTIFSGQGVDFGDAPDSYRTLEATNGARHAIVNGFFLGKLVDAELDGQPTVVADGDGDDEDGVVFLTPLHSGLVSTIEVTASAPGFLDGWIDLNRDGDFSDTIDRVIISEPLVAGVNTLSFDLPSTVTLGNSYARFRLSSTGGLGPSGEAVDGEVEDYAVTILAAPYQNPVWRLDVNGNGSVEPLDALLIINFLNFHPGFSQLPNPPGPPVGPPPPFYDVTGDGNVAPDDALQVINYLNFQAASGEAEASPISGGASFSAGGGGEGEAPRSIVDVQLVLPPATRPAASVSSPSLAALAPSAFDSDMASGQAQGSGLERPAPREFEIDLPGSIPRELLEHEWTLQSEWLRQQTADFAANQDDIGKNADRLEDLLGEIVDDVQLASEPDSAHDEIFARLGQ